MLEAKSMMGAVLDRWVQRSENKCPKLKLHDKKNITNRYWYHFFSLKLKELRTEYTTTIEASLLFIFYLSSIQATLYKSPKQVSYSGGGLG